MTLSFGMVSHGDPRRHQAAIALLRAIYGDCRIYLHHDAKDDIDTVWLRRRHIALVERRSIVWGGWSLVEVFLSIMRAHLATHAPEHLVFLSAMDVPVADAQRAQSLLASADVHIHRFPVVGTSWLEERYARRWHVLRPNLPARFIGHSLSRMDRITRGRLVEVRGLSGAAAPALSRRRPVGLVGHQLTYGSAWFSASPLGVERLVLAADGTRITEHFRRTLIPDEAFFHTALTSPRTSAGLRVSDSDARYIQWSGGPHPDLLTEEHLAAAVASPGHALARKVDLLQRPELSDFVRRALAP